jgi:thioredoxin-related protein
MLRSFVLSAAMTVAFFSLAKAETVLLMAEERGCYWCARWTEEIGPIYPKTAVGKTAPLIRYNRRDETPDVLLKNSVRFTPTFILAHDGQEVGRIEGYPGEDFFWALLKTLFTDANIAINETGKTNDS